MLSLINFSQYGGGKLLPLITTKSFGDIVKHNDNFYIVAGTLNDKSRLIFKKWILLKNFNGYTKSQIKTFIDKVKSTRGTHWSANSFKRLIKTPKRSTKKR